MIPYEQRSFYNTTSETGDTLKDYKEKATSQDMDVLKLLKRMTGLRLITPYNIWRVLVDTNPSYKNTPRDSIKRSFSNLKNRGLIEKSGKTMGDYGRKVCTWRLVQQ